MKARNIIAVRTVGGLPINGLHAVLELGGRLELDLTEDSPGNDDGTDGSGDDDKDDQSRLCDLASTTGGLSSLSARFNGGSAGDRLGYANGRF